MNSIKIQFKNKSKVKTVLRIIIIIIIIANQISCERENGARRGV